MVLSSFTFQTEPATLPILNTEGIILFGRAGPCGLCLEHPTQCCRLGCPCIEACIFTVYATGPQTVFEYCLINDHDVACTG